MALSSNILGSSSDTESAGKTVFIIDESASTISRVVDDKLIETKDAEITKTSIEAKTQTPDGSIILRINRLDGTGEERLIVAGGGLTTSYRSCDKTSVPSMDVGESKF